MESKRRGIASLVLSLCSMFVPYFNLYTGALGIAFGIRALKTKGSNLGKMGLTLGIIALISYFCQILFSIAMIFVTLFLCLITILFPLLMN